MVGQEQDVYAMFPGCPRLVVHRSRRCGCLYFRLCEFKISINFACSSRELTNVERGQGDIHTNRIKGRGTLRYHTDPRKITTVLYGIIKSADVRRYRRSDDSVRERNSTIPPTHNTIEPTSKTTSGKMSKSPTDTDGYLLPPSNSLTNDSAPNAWPGHIDRIAVAIIYALLLLVVLPPAVILSIAKFYLFGPSHPDFDLKTQVMTNVMYWFILFLFLFKLPGRDRGEDKIAKTMRRKGMGVEQVVVPPCPESSRIGWAKHTVVKPTPRPGFMIWPESRQAGSEGKRGKGMERAKRGEKVIIYFVGGGFISGHPLLSHLAWTVSEILDTRVFCESPPPPTCTLNRLPLPRTRD